MKPHEIIRKKREELGMSQAKLGEMTGFSQQAIQKIEKGTRRLDECKIISISKALHLFPSDLFNEEPSAGALDVQMLSIIISNVKNWLKENKLSLDVEKEAELISYIYAKLITKPESARSKSNIVEIAEIFRDLKIAN